MTIYKKKMVKVPASTVCDITKKESYSKLILQSYYGSKFDGELICLDLSDEVVAEIKSFLEKRFGKNKIKKHTEYTV